MMGPRLIAMRVPCPAAVARLLIAAAAGLVLMLSCARLSPVAAQSFVRDAEIEHTIRRFADPIFQAAGLVPGNVKIYLINDPNINAFVAAGQNLFVNTGTILQLEHPRQLIGIIAHETGHIAGGHLARASDAQSAAAVPLLIGTLLGIAAAASGSPDAGMGILLAGQDIAQRSFLAFNRTQESSADQAAIKFLNATHQSGVGLLETFERFSGQEVLSEQRQDPYVRTHPLSRERMAALDNLVKTSPYYETPERQADIVSYARIRAKLSGFLERRDIVFRKYPLSNQSIDARYARSIAFYRIPEIDKAIAEVDSIIRDEPNNPFFHELKGQILFENGRVAESVPEHEASARLLPDEPLFKIAYGQALIATEKPANVNKAITVLNRALDQDEDNPGAWYHLAAAYGQLNNVPMAEYATAERLFRTGDAGTAVFHAQRALCGLPKGTVAARRAQDMVDTVKSHLEVERGDAAKRAKAVIFGPDGKGRACADDDGGPRDRG